MIRVTDVTKRYGTHLALDAVSLDVPTGSVYGLIGPNGAGKTTLLSILSGMRTADSGSIEIGVDRRRRAVLPDAPRFEKWLTAREVVALSAHLADIRDPAAVGRVLSDTGLAADADRPVGGFSRGMLQRLGLAATLVSDPEVILLDEPAAALDPAGRREVLDLLGLLRGSATVVFSSHILGDVQAVCDRVGILDEGRIRFEGSVDELIAGAASSAYLVRVRRDAAVVRAALVSVAWVTAAEETTPSTLRVTVTSHTEAERHLPGLLAATGVPVVSFEPEPVTLEAVFLDMTRRQVLP